MRIVLAAILGALLGYSLDSMGHSMLTPEYWVVMGLTFALIINTAWIAGDW